MKAFTVTCEKCKHWYHLYNGIYVCGRHDSVSWTHCGNENDYAKFEPRIETGESK